MHPTLNSSLFASAAFCFLLHGAVCRCNIVANADVFVTVLMICAHHYPRNKTVLEESQPIISVMAGIIWLPMPEVKGPLLTYSVHHAMRRETKFQWSGIRVD